SAGHTHGTGPRSSRASSGRPGSQRWGAPLTAPLPDADGRASRSATERVGSRCRGQMTRMTRFGPILGTPYAKGSIEGFTGITLNRVIRVIRRCCPRAWRPGDVRSVVAARRYELLISDTTK